MTVIVLATCGAQSEVVKETVVVEVEKAVEKVVGGLATVVEAALRSGLG